MASGMQSRANIQCSPELGNDPFDAPDAESCCGECADQLEEVSSQQVIWGTSCVTSTSDHTAVSVSAACRPYCFSGQWDSGCHAESDRTQHMGDDFEALDDVSELLDDATDGYPGGVEAALADWEAAVSDKAAPDAVAGAAAEVSSCCNYDAHAAQQQQQWCGMGLLQQHKAVRPLPWQQLPVCSYLLALQQQQQQQQQQVQQAQQHQTVGAASAVGLGLARACCGTGTAPQRMPQCEYAAFKGDVVGAVLAGLMPAPSCDSSDDWLAPLGFGLGVGRC